MRNKKALKEKEKLISEIVKISHLLYQKEFSFFSEI